MKKVFIAILLIVVVLGGGGYILAEKADAAEPGDSLYQVDLFVEDIERLLTFDELKKAKLETKILDERISELESLVESNSDLTEIVTAVSAQQDRVREHLGTVENNPEKYQDGQLEQSRNRYQEQLEQHIEVMEKVQNKGEDSTLQIKQQLQEDLENCQSGNCTKKAQVKDTPEENEQEKLNDNQRKGNPNN